MRMNVGDIAPDFELPASDDSTVRLSSFKGTKNVVLCFYPKNHLFMCPSKKVFKMAQSVINAYPEILNADSVLFAISVDTVDDQKKFVQEYRIPYLHLSDTSKEVCKQYAGLNIAGLARRTTFIIDKNGVIRKIFTDIDVEKHGQEIAKSLAEIS
ncbi:putative AhpC/TSA family protein [Candidatus Nitrosotenuis uzonensis]|uniref:thioredoxin-dependent peroxiredoxin n=2 Tax=Candidatus Nitrosotenuis uzonensis TaxID=1407055 RepID=A0A812F7L8_9ARCH|nr:putative AhpC/TSA family protein [Candidatus Nitrosotenuis uzonensis]